MPRLARVTIPGLPHHVTQRGNNRQDVFLTPLDYRTYLQFLGEETLRQGVSIWAYCLMINHVHLVAVPEREDSLTLAVGKADERYTRHFHRLQHTSGHLWQNRFYSCVLDETHCWVAMRYVERNPVRAGIVPHAWEYRWSSAAAHCGSATPPDLLSTTEWGRLWKPEHWIAWLAAAEEEQELLGLRAKTRSGRPLGSAEFAKGITSRRTGGPQPPPGDCSR